MRKRSLLAGILMPILMGLIGFANLAGKQRFQLFHTVDVVQLLATGMCFGVALMSVIVALRLKRLG